MLMLTDTAEELKNAKGSKILKTGIENAQNIITGEQTSQQQKWKLTHSGTQQNNKICILLNMQCSS